MEAEEEHDSRAALVAMVVANSHLGRKRTPFKLKDFLFMRRRKRAQTPEEMQTMILAINAALGGEVIE